MYFHLRYVIITLEYGEIHTIYSRVLNENIISTRDHRHFFTTVIIACIQYALIFNTQYYCVCKSWLVRILVAANKTDLEEEHKV